VGLWASAILGLQEVERGPRLEVRERPYHRLQVVVHLAGLLVKERLDRRLQAVVRLEDRLALEVLDYHQEKEEGVAKDREALLVAQRRVAGVGSGLVQAGHLSVEEVG